MFRKVRNILCMAWSGRKNPPDCSDNHIAILGGTTQIIAVPGLKPCNHQPNGSLLRGSGWCAGVPLVTCANAPTWLLIVWLSPQQPEETNVQSFDWECVECVESV